MNGPVQSQIKAKSTSSAASSVAPAGLLQRNCACGGVPGVDGECSACRNKRLQRQSANQAEPASVLPIVHEVLATSGEPLAAGVQVSFGQRFGHDFGQVRVHTDSQAVASARAVNARAYTVGQHVVFGRAQYQPGSAAGRQLLAHELAHVVQQGSVGQHAPENLDIDPPDSQLEKAAQQVAQRAMLGDPIGLRSGGTVPNAGRLVQRDLATEAPEEVRDQPDLTEAQIRTALAFNRSRFTRQQTIEIQDIIGTEPTGTWTESDVLAVAQIQEEYNLTADGIIGTATFRFLDREQQLEGLAKDDTQCLTSFFVQGFPVTFLPAGTGQHRLEGHFQVRAQFPARCGCSNFEYRQSIKGSFTRQRGGVVDDITSIFTQLPAGSLTSDFREDGDTNDNPVNYGHRDQPADTNPEDRYLNDADATDQANGCRYRNEDFPSANLNTQSGDVFNATMQFRGEIQRSKRTVRTLEWTAIRGTFRVP